MAERLPIAPLSIAQDGPGVDLRDYAEAGIAIQMSDPDPGLGYARNRVTLTYDLSGSENVVPARGPVADFDFDGVAMSDDGAGWFEARGLRDLSSAGAGIGERQGAGGGPLLDRLILETRARCRQLHDTTRDAEARESVREKPRRESLPPNSSGPSQATPHQPERT